MLWPPRKSSHRIGSMRSMLCTTPEIQGKGALSTTRPGCPQWQKEAGEEPPDQLGQPLKQAWHLNMWLGLLPWTGAAAEVGLYRMFSLGSWPLTLTLQGQQHFPRSPTRSVSSTWSTPAVKPEAALFWRMQSHMGMEGTFSHTLLPAPRRTPPCELLITQHTTNAVNTCYWDLLGSFHRTAEFPPRSLGFFSILVRARHKILELQWGL